VNTSEVRSSVGWRRRARGVGRDANWWAAVLFMIGSFLFALGSFPLYSQRVDPGTVGVTFFVGSIFFTSAGAAQLLFTIRTERPADRAGRLFDHGFAWWSAAVQLVGTVLFNVSTFDALLDGLSTEQTNRLVWSPDLFGSVAFLLASYLAWVDLLGIRWVVRSDDDEWWVVALNAAGSIVFMVSAIAAFVLPTTGEVLNTTLVNLGTFLGAVGFFLGAYLLLPVVPTGPASTS
jgi:hypothetical protein